MNDEDQDQDENNHEEKKVISNYNSLGNNKIFLFVFI
jgi:hypothetical protein